MAKKVSSADALLAKLSGRQKDAKKHLPLRTGKRKSKIARYFDRVRPERKLRHLLRHNGAAAARAWAEAFGGTDVLRRLKGED